MRPVEKRILTLAPNFMDICEWLEKESTGKVVQARLRLAERTKHAAEDATRSLADEMFLTRCDCT